jgi:superoxide dismutase, Fe-Mn family
MTDRELLPAPGDSTRGDVIAAEAVRALIEAGTPVHLLDVRPRHYLAESGEIASGAVWRDPEALHEWIANVPRGMAVVTMCAFGRSVGMETAAALREAGIDARCMTGGHAAWKAMNGPMQPLGSGD